MKIEYIRELKALKENEDNISFFKNLISNDIWNDAIKRKEILDCVIEYCDKNSLEIAKAWMLYYLAWHYSEEAMAYKAIEILSSAKDIFKYYDNVNGLLYTYNGLVFMYCDLGQYIIANEYGVLGIGLADRNVDNDGIIKILLSTSIANMYSGDFVYAKELLHLIEKKYLNDNVSPNDRRIYYKTLIEVDLNLNKTDDILKYIELLRDSIYLFKEYYQIPELHKLRGLYFSTLNMVELADEEFSISNDISTEKGYLLQKCESGIYWAKMKFKIGDFEGAINLLSKLLEIAKDNDYKRIIRTISFTLYDYYKGIGDYNTSLKYLEIYIVEIENMTDYNVIDESESSFSKYNRTVNLSNIFENKTEIISRIGEKILSTLNLKDLLFDINIEMRKLVPVDFLGIALVDENKNEFNVSVLEFDTFSEMNAVKIVPNTTFCDICISNRKIIVVNDIRKEYKKYFQTYDLTNAGTTDPLSLAFLPLISNNKVIGALIVESLKENAYNSDDIYTMRIVSNYLGISINNALMYKVIEEEANYDSITGFLTKREIIKELKNTLVENKTRDMNICFAMMDLDNLKIVNDTYGHAAGDELIISISKKIRKHLRQTDYIGRFGGDEFFLISVGLNREDAFNYLNQIRKAVEKNEINVDGKIVKGTISIGAYMLDEKAVTDLEIIQAADRALYKAKECNRNIVCFNE